MNAEALAMALGGKRRGRQWAACCPAHPDRDPSLIIFDGFRAVQVRCLSGCDSRDVIAALRARGLWDGERPRKLTREERAALRKMQREREQREAAERAAATAQALRIWDDAGPALGTAVEYLYLQWHRGFVGAGEGIGNGVGIGDGKKAQDDPASPWRQSWRRLLTDTIRFHPRCPREHDRQPAMVALMRSCSTGAPQAIHRTFLTRRWDKDGTPMMLGPASGAAIMLAGVPPCRRLFVAEGIESALGVVWHGVIEPTVPGAA